MTVATHYEVSGFHLNVYSLCCNYSHFRITQIPNWLPSPLFSLYVNFF